MKKLALLAVFLALPIFGQTAKVIALSPADAAEAKILYAQREALDKKIEALREKITRSYLVEDKVRYDSHVQFQYLVLRSGWHSDFLYSEDFRFIVPNTSSASGSLTICGNCCASTFLNGNILTTTPALGGTFVAN